MPTFNPDLCSLSLRSKVPAVSCAVFVGASMNQSALCPKVMTLVVVKSCERRSLSQWTQEPICSWLPSTGPIDSLATNAGHLQVQVYSGWAPSPWTATTLHSSYVSCTYLGLKWIKSSRVDKNSKFVLDLRVFVPSKDCDALLAAAYVTTLNLSCNTKCYKRKKDGLS